MSNRAVIITVSDRCSRGEAEDRSGPAALAQLARFDAVAIHRQIIPDEVAIIRGLVQGWISRCELIVCSGGTGVAPRDVTPEAILPLIERPLPGFGEAMRLRAFERTPLSIISRSGAGISGSTLIVWLPGSPGGVSECLEMLTPAIRHVCQFLRGAAPH